MAGFLDIVTPVTIANYALGALDGVSLHNPALKAMREKADWEYDVGGDSLSGVVEGGYDKPIISAPGMDLTPNLKSTVRYARWTQVWGEIAGVKVVDNGALRRNSGKQALVKLRDKEIPAMLRGMLDKVDGLLHQFFNQNIASPTQSSGTVTGLPMAGLPSFLMPTGGTFNGASDGTLTGTTLAATDKEAVCVAQTYGGLSLAPSGLTGIDNVVADAWTPGALVNTTSTAWNGAASASANVLAYLQYGANRVRRFSSNDPALRPDAEFGAWLGFSLFQYLGSAIAAKQSIYLSGGRQTGPGAPQVAIGTNEDALPHAGYMWRWDERIPVTAGFLITWAQVQAKVQTLFAGIEGNGNPLSKSGEDAGLIETAITYDPVRRQWIVTGTNPMQFMMTPRYFAAFRAYA